MPRQILWHAFANPVPYTSGVKLQESIHRLQLERRRLNQSYPDVLLLLQHRPVYTTGRRQLVEELEHERKRLQQLGADWVPASRGGETTYHGPGQLVAYPLVDLKRMSLSVKDYVCALQKSLTSFANFHGVTTVPSEHTGAFVSNSSKLGSIGVQVRHRLTTHGLSINITEEPIPWFNEVVACGLPGVKAVSLAGEMGASISVESVIPTLLGRVQRHLDASLSRLSQSVDPELSSLILEAEKAASEAGPYTLHPQRH